MFTHLARLSLAVADRPLREAGFFLADPLRGYMENTSVIPLAIFEQMEEAMRKGRLSGTVALSASKAGDSLRGPWQAVTLPNLSIIAEAHARALEAVSCDFRAYRGLSSTHAGVKLMFDDDLVIPIKDCRTLLARSVMRGQIPNILPWLVVPPSP